MARLIGCAAACVVVIASVAIHAYDDVMAGVSHDVVMVDDEPHVMPMLMMFEHVQYVHQKVDSCFRVWMYGALMMELQHHVDACYQLRYDVDHHHAEAVNVVNRILRDDHHDARQQVIV